MKAPRAQEKTSARARILAPWLVFLAALALYAGSVGHDMVWDDTFVVEEQLARLDSVAKVLAPPADIPEFSLSYYRPLVVASYWLDEGLARLFWPAAEREAGRRFTFHFSVALSHAAACLLVLLAGRSFLRLSPGTGLTGELAAVSGALLFAAHPIHVESVAWMAGRSDVLCAFFALSCVLVFLGHLDKGGALRLAAACVLLFLALLAKETALGLLPFLALLEFAGVSRAKENQARLPRWICLSGTVVGYFILRSLAVRGSAAVALLEPADLLRTALASLGWYTRKLIWPFPQKAFFLEMPATGYALLGVMVLAAVAWAIFLAVRRTRAQVEALAATWFIGTLAPALVLAVGTLKVAQSGESAPAWKHAFHLVAASGATGLAPLAERYLYLPSVGGCLLAGWGLALLGRFAGRTRTDRFRAGVTLGLTLALALPAAAATLQRSRVFGDAARFWTDAAEKTPGMREAHWQVADLLDKQGRREQALDRLRIALAQNPGAAERAALHQRRGTWLAEMGRITQARDEFQAMAQADPASAAAHLNWAVSLLTLAQEPARAAELEALRAEAIRLLRRALELNPDHAKARYYLGLELLKAGRTGEGASELRRLIASQPQSQEAARAKQWLDRAPLSR